MKLSMGNIKSKSEPGTKESHFGFPFTVQEDGTLITDEIDEELLPVAEVEIRAGRLIEHKSAKQQAEDAARIAEKAAKNAAKAAEQAAKDAVEAGKKATKK